MRISDWSSDVCSSDLEIPADRKCGGPASQTHRSLFDECSDTTARHSPDLPPERRGKRSPPVVWSALRSGLRPSLRSDQTTDPTGHHSRRSTGHRSCRRAVNEAQRVVPSAGDHHFLLTLTLCQTLDGFFEGAETWTGTTTIPRRHMAIPAAAPGNPAPKRRSRIKCAG